jgi:hypothetical protein
MAPQKRQKATATYYSCSSSPLSSPPASPQRIRSPSAPPALPPPRRHRTPSLEMEAALFPMDPATPPNPSCLLPGELGPPVSSELVPFTPPGKVRKKKSTIRPDGDTPIFPMVTIPAFIPGPEWDTRDTRGKASLAPTQEELVLWTPSSSIAAASSGSAGPQPEASSQFATESAVRELIAGYRTPVPAQPPPSTPGLSVSSVEASEIISPTPRLPNKARPAWIEPADHLQNVTGPFRADPMFQAADEILRVHEGVDRRSASAPAEFVDLTTPTPPLPPLPSGRPDPESISAGAQRWYQEQRELEEYMGTPLADWTVHYLVLSRLAARKEMAGARPQQERDFCNVRGRGSLSHYLVVYSESPSRWCSLAIILPIYLHHNLLLVSNRSIQNTYRLVILVVLTLLSLSCSLERFAFVYHVNISKTRYTVTPEFHHHVRNRANGHTWFDCTPENRV